MLAIISCYCIFVSCQLRGGFLFPIVWGLELSVYAACLPPSGTLFPLYLAGIPLFLWLCCCFFSLLLPGAALYIVPSGWYGDLPPSFWGCMGVLRADAGHLLSYICVLGLCWAAVVASFLTLLVTLFSVAGYEFYYDCAVLGFFCFCGSTLP